MWRCGQDRAASISQGSPRRLGSALGMEAAAQGWGLQGRNSTGGRGSDWVIWVVKGPAVNIDTIGWTSLSALIRWGMPDDVEWNYFRYISTNQLIKCLPHLAIWLHVKNIFCWLKTRFSAPAAELIQGASNGALRQFHVKMVLCKHLFDMSLLLIWPCKNKVTYFFWTRVFYQ